MLLSYFPFKLQVLNYQDTIIKLENEVGEKSKEISAMEEAVFLMDENSKHERSFLTQLLKAERKLIPASLTIDRKLLVCSQNLSKTVRAKLEILSKNLTLKDAITFLMDLQCDVDKFVEKEDAGVSEIEFKQAKGDLDDIRQTMNTGKDLEEVFTVVNPLPEQGNSFVITTMNSRYYSYFYYFFSILK